MTMENNQAAAREARRFLTDRVRNDWTFPDPPPRLEHSDEELHGVSEFRERFYGTTSDSPADGDDGDDDGAEHSEDGNGDYKFDSPDSVGQKVVRGLEERAARRKRKRRRVLEEEMRWNEGMAVFVRRRDAWTGAASVRKYARRRSRPDNEMLPEELEAQAQIDAILDETAVVASAVAETNSNGSPEQQQEHGSDGPQEEREHAQDQGPTTRNVDMPASEEPLVPLAPPLLAHNVIRQSISPKSYPDIYAKIVVAGQTPKVPINLSDMTRALVQGWKDDGEWPPRAGPADPLMGRKKTGRGVALSTVLGGFGGAGSLRAGAEAAKSPTTPTTTTNHHGEFLAHHPHVKRGVESVKRVFRLSGSSAGHGSPSSGFMHEAGTPGVG